jgi:hypothetical protein
MIGSSLNRLFFIPNSSRPRYERILVFNGRVSRGRSEEQLGGTIADSVDDVSRLSKDVAN